LLVVMPVSEDYLGMLRDVFPRGTRAKLRFVPIGSAGAIVAAVRAYESYDLPSGDYSGFACSPGPRYDDAACSVLLQIVASLAKTTMEVRRAGRDLGRPHSADSYCRPTTERPRPSVMPADQSPVVFCMAASA
jgi:hypothetical protein